MMAIMQFGLYSVLGEHGIGVRNLAGEGLLQFCKVSQLSRFVMVIHALTNFVISKSLCKDGLLPDFQSLAYLTYVRPIVEYASTVWSPYVKSDIERLEMVQRKAARFIYNNFSAYSSVSSMLSQLNWQSLE